MRSKRNDYWTLADLRGLDPSLCTHRIFFEDKSRPVMEAHRQLNPKVWEVVKEEIMKWLNAEIIYPISDSQCDGDSLQHMNTGIPSEPRYTLRKRIHPQLQQHAVLFLIHKFGKLTLNEVSKEDLSKSLKESVDPKGINFPPLPFLN